MNYEIDYEIPVISDIDTEISKLPTTSAKIRYLDQKGFTKYQISKKLQIRYQHVRNILITPVKNPKT